MNTTLHLPDMRRGYRRLLRTMLHGDDVEVRGEPTLEIQAATLVFDDPAAPLLPIGVGRRINTKLAAVEALELIGGVSKPKLRLRAAPGYASVLVDADDLDYGAYGPRVAPQLGEVVRLLKRDPTTRQAVLSIWRPDDVDHVGDKPCTLTIQFLLRDNQLWMVVNMRSQDAWLGAGMDMFVFGQLRDTVARLLHVEPGPYVHHVGSLHLYKRDMDGLDRVVRMSNTELVQQHEELPHGIHVPPARDGWSSPATSTTYAEALLTNPADVAHYVASDVQLARHYNPWYARQVGALLATEVKA